MVFVDSERRASEVEREGGGEGEVL